VVGVTLTGGASASNSDAIQGSVDVQFQGQCDVKAERVEELYFVTTAGENLLLVQRNCA